MGLTSKILLEAAAAAGITMSKRRASEIINGQAFIHPNEIELIAQILGRTVDELYIDLGSVLSVACPVLSIGQSKLNLCVRQQCAWWDWEMQWCCMKTKPGAKGIK